MPLQMTPLQIVSTADALIEFPQDDSAGLWPRTAAVLGRQAIEGALRQYWRLRAPGLERCSGNAQLLCLVAYLGKRDLAQQTHATWSALSRACHHHPYELNPSADELRSWLASARRFADEVARQTAAAVALPGQA